MFTNTRIFKRIHAGRILKMLFSEFKFASHKDRIFKTNISFINVYTVHAAVNSTVARESTRSFVCLSVVCFAMKTLPKEEKNGARRVCRKVNNRRCFAADGSSLFCSVIFKAFM